MRISVDERHSFIDVISKYISENAELMLFGSRADDSAKGGDIDLLLIVSNDAIKSEIAFQKVEILAEIKSKIGDQKIDLVITTQNEIPQSAFLKSIMSGAVSIKSWK